MPGVSLFAQASTALVCLLVFGCLFPLLVFPAWCSMIRRRDPHALRLIFAHRYCGGSARDALLASANAGGENVHRNEAEGQRCGMVVAHISFCGLHVLCLGRPQVLGLLLGAEQGRGGLKGIEEWRLHLVATP